MSEQQPSSSPLPFRPAPAELPRSSSPPSPYIPSESTLAIAHANRELSENRPQAALDLYTEVLNDLDPGHPIAFLNRSLCYLLLGLPHLAVMDAHRSLFCVQILNDRDYEDAGVYGEQLFNMGLFTVMTDSLEEPWLAEPGCYVCNGSLDYLNVRLASIAAKPYTRINAVEEGESGVSKIVTLHMGNDIILKAYYRLAVGLWKCGGGAWKSALNSLCAAESQSICTKDDRTDLGNLQNAILMQMDEEMQNEAAIKRWLIQSGAMKSDKATLKAYDDSRVRGLFDSEFTKVRRELYLWDEYSLTWKNHHSVLKDLDEETSEKTKDNCKLEIRNDTSKAPKLTLSAQRDIPDSKSIFQDVGLLHAVTPLPKSRGNYSCDTCGSLLNISKELCSKAVREARDICDELDKRSTAAQNQLVFRHSRIIDPEFVPKEEQRRIDSIFNETDANENRALGSLQSSTDEQDSEIPGLPAPHPSTGFQLCPVCRRTCSCSLKCHQLSVATHTSSMCSKNVEEIANSKKVPRSWTGLVSASAQNLLNLLLFRIIARAVKVGVHPLDSYTMKILHGDLENSRRLAKDGENDVRTCQQLWNDNSAIKISNIFPNRQTLKEIQEGVPAKTEKANTMPWSYSTNVVEPIEALYRLGMQNQLGDGGLDLALDTQSFDGWMLEAMRAKVASGMTMSKYPRFAVTFDDAGDCAARACVVPSSVLAPFALGVAPKSGASTPSDFQGADERADVENSWIASLHPFYTLLDPLEDGTPNVVVYERRGALLCKSVGTDNAQAVVQKGERLRRSDDVVPWRKGDDNPEMAFPESFDFPSFSDAEESWDRVDDDVFEEESSDSVLGTD